MIDLSSKPNHAMSKADRNYFVQLRARNGTNLNCPTREPRDYLDRNMPAELLAPFGGTREQALNAWSLNSTICC